MTGRLQGKVTLVTGGNRGIGRSIALLAAAEGAHVAIAGRNTEQGEQTARELRARGAEAIFVAADLRDAHAVRSLVERVTCEYGGLDVLVNNAGAGAKLSNVEPDDPPEVRWNKLIGANLTATYLVSAYAMLDLRRTKGTIVNISSTAAIHGNYGSYGAAKAGVEGLTRSMAVEGAPYGIRVNCVSPGWISTEATYPPADADPDSSAQRQAWEREASLLGRMGRPEEIAEVVVFLASEQASFVTGAVLVVDGGLTIIDPTAKGWLGTMRSNAFTSGPGAETKGHAQ